jgi:hypothetical protein
MSNNASTFALAACLQTEIDRQWSLEHQIRTSHCTIEAIANSVERDEHLQDMNQLVLAVSEMKQAREHLNNLELQMRTSIDRARHYTHLILKTQGMHTGIFDD